MKVTLIFCHVGVAGFNSERRPGDREGSWIGHGVASVAASAKAAGHKVDLIDMRQLSGWDGLESEIIRRKSDVFGISVSPVDSWNALKTTLLIKRNSPLSRVVIGGIHPTVFPSNYDHPGVDCIVQGEGEISFVEILKDLEAGREPKRFVIAKKPDLDQLPFVDRSLFDYRRELSCFFAPGQQTPSITMLAGRGCPYKCSYCQPCERAVFGNPFRIRSPENVMTELVQLKGKYRYKSVTFWDDTFTFKPKWVEEFCNLYISEKIGASMAVCSRADIICHNPDMVDHMAAAGVDWIVIGLESGNQRILDLIKKGTTVEQNRNAVKICKKNGIKVFATYMLGLPTETSDESLETMRMIDEVNPEFPSPFYFVPIPGTDIYNFCLKNDLVEETMRDKTIERTGKFARSIKGINYDYIDTLLSGNRESAKELKNVSDNAIQRNA